MAYGKEILSLNECGNISPITLVRWSVFMNCFTLNNLPYLRYRYLFYGKFKNIRIDSYILSRCIVFNKRFNFL